MRRACPEYNRRGVTLVELLVTLGIVGVVVTVIAGFANYTAGRLRSSQNKVLNDSFRLVTDTIGQKIYNANEKVTIGGDTIYGFKEKSNILIIVSKGETNTTCTFFGKNGDTVSMAQNSCGSIPTTSELTSSLTPNRIKITDFTITVSNAKTSDALGENVPTVDISVSAVDLNDEKNKGQSKSTFTIDYENLKYLSDLSTP